MTYNFDPDHWYSMQRRLLERRHREGELDDGEYEEALERLEARHEEMLDRLDGTYELP